MKIQCLILGFGLLLAGCMNYRPAVTSDQVLARQYAARGIHGALSGPEAAIIADNQRKNIGARTADLPDAVPPR